MVCENRCIISVCLEKVRLLLNLFYAMIYIKENTYEWGIECNSLATPVTVKPDTHPMHSLGKGCMV